MSHLSFDNRVFSMSDLNLESFNLGKQPDGTYNVVFTAFNIMSSRGDFYMMSDTVRKMFDAGSPMLIRIQEGDMKQEDGHPELNPTQSLEDFRRRLFAYDKNNVCAITNSVKLHDSPISVPGIGNEIYIMTANITPTGPKGPLLKQSLDDPRENTAFSIRSFSNNTVKNGITYKDTYMIITADWVQRPGIPVAKKSIWSGMNLESEEYVLTDKDKMDMLNSITETLNSHNLESVDSMYLNELKGILTGCDDDSCLYRRW